MIGVVFMELLKRANSLHLEEKNAPLLPFQSAFQEANFLISIWNYFNWARRKKNYIFTTFWNGVSGYTSASCNAISTLLTSAGKRLLSLFIKFKLSEGWNSLIGPRLMKASEAFKVANLRKIPGLEILCPIKKMLILKKLYISFCCLHQNLFPNYQ